VGSWLFKQLAKTYSGHAFWPLLTGIVVYVALRGIPLLGILFGIFATLIGLEAAWLALHAWRSRHPAVVPAERCNNGVWGVVGVLRTHNALLLLYKKCLNHRPAPGFPQCGADCLTYTYSANNYPLPCLSHAVTATLLKRSHPGT
jgi:hypothetical protein